MPNASVAEKPVNPAPPLVEVAIESIDRARALIATLREERKVLIGLLRDVEVLITPHAAEFGFHLKVEPMPVEQAQAIRAALQIVTPVRESARNCGCDPGAGWTCAEHQAARNNALSGAL